MTRVLAHGTIATYNNHGCRCDECRATNSAYQRARRARLRPDYRPRPGPLTAGDGDPWHGTENGYGNHGCRCADCTRAHRDYYRLYRARRGNRAAS